jgi:hypothetical protein
LVGIKSTRGCWDVIWIQDCEIYRTGGGRVDETMHVIEMSQKILGTRGWGSDRFPVFKVNHPRWTQKMFRRRKEGLARRTLLSMLVKMKRVMNGVLLPYCSWKRLFISHGSSFGTWFCKCHVRDQDSKSDCQSPATKGKRTPLKDHMERRFEMSL